MWYLILALLFGQGGHSKTNDNNGQPTVQARGDNSGEVGTPRPPRPPSTN